MYIKQKSSHYAAYRLVQCNLHASLITGVLLCYKFQWQLKFIYIFCLQDASRVCVVLCTWATVRFPRLMGSCILSDGSFQHEMFFILEYSKHLFFWLAELLSCTIILIECDAHHINLHKVELCYKCVTWPLVVLVVLVSVRYETQIHLLTVETL